MSANRSILVTGAAGFIGFHLSRRLLQEGFTVIGIDNFTPYYDVSLKKARINQLEKEKSFHPIELDLADRIATARFFEKNSFDVVLHMAAQPGVRYSIDHPELYIESNIVGFLNVLEGCRHHGVKHLLYASSSSVYGIGSTSPFSVDHATDHPSSLYGATKKSGELMAYSYAHLYRLPCTGLRFFTVYGPWGRPDMAYFHFTKSILEGTPVSLYGNGSLKRDFTYVDDVVESVLRLVEKTPNDEVPHHIYNIGNDQPVAVSRMIEILEKLLGKKAVIQSASVPKSDLLSTHADRGDLRKEIGYQPSTSLEEGLEKFVTWYLSYYGKH